MKISFQTSLGVTQLSQAGATDLATPVRRRSGPLGGQRPHEVGKRGGSPHPFDVCTDAAQFRFHLVIATIQVVDAVDPCFTVGHQAGNHQAG